MMRCHCVCADQALVGALVPDRGSARVLGLDPACEGERVRERVGGDAREERLDRCIGEPRGDHSVLVRRASTAHQMPQNGAANVNAKLGR